MTTPVEPDDDVGHSSRPTIRRLTRTRTLFVVLLVGAAIPTWSLGRAMAADSGLSTSGKVASWARNYRLGWLVDTAEWIRYRNPPPDETPVSLPLQLLDSSAEHMDTAAPPAAVPTPHRPRLTGEGGWTSARLVGGRTVVWTTGVRPSHSRIGMTATHVAIDGTSLEAVLHNGTEVPGGRDWIRGDSLSPEEVGRAVFAFNGAFRREHSGGGYLTEGREVWPLKSGVASLAIDHDGRIHVGTWGDHIDPAGFDGRPWRSVRQNLRLLVEDGKLSPALDSGYWGGGKKGEIYILRSAVCVRFDGRLMFTIMGPTDATSLAGAMRDAGCRHAMQLDQNESYPRGYLFDEGSPRPVDSRMKGHDTDFIDGYPRDFIVLLEK